jgi:membrane fusion protein (multidrug efflux system)
MKRRFKHAKRITAIIVIAAAFFIIIAVWPEKRQTVEDQASKAKAIKVIAETIGTAKLTETIPVTGSFEPMTTIEVIPEISGQLQRLRLADNTLVDVGVTVKNGEVIAVIDHDIYLAQLAECQATFEASKVTLAETERERERIIRLFESGSATEQARDKAVTAAQLAAAQVKQAEAALARIKVTLDKATIEAPVTGVISEKYVDEGNMVGPSTPLVRIVQIETLKVLGGVSERYLPRLVPGKTPVRIKTDAFPEDEFEGMVYRVGVSVDAVTRTSEVEIRVPNPEGELKPGMFARITIVIGQKENVTVVPDSALVREYDNVYVFVANNGKTHRRYLKLGLSQGDYHEVLKGLSPGDMVITHGQNQLEDGQEVELFPETTR